MALALVQNTLRVGYLSLLLNFTVLACLMARTRLRDRTALRAQLTSGHDTQPK